MNSAVQELNRLHIESYRPCQHPRRGEDLPLAATPSVEKTGGFTRPTSLPFRGKYVTVQDRPVGKEE